MRVVNDGASMVFQSRNQSNTVDLLYKLESTKLLIFLSFPKNLKSRFPIECNHKTHQTDGNKAEKWVFHPLLKILL